MSPSSFSPSRLEPLQKMICGELYTFLHLKRVTSEHNVLSVMVRVRLVDRRFQSSLLMVKSFSFNMVLMCLLYGVVY
jgi:hypothetical protein